MKTTVIVLTTFFVIIVIGFVSWFVFFLEPEAAASTTEEKELLDLATSKDVIIVFNSGGWGNATLKEATDFTPILAGIQQTLAELGYSSVITPFVRTPGGLLGKISDEKDLMDSFRYSSEILASEIEFVIDNSPGKQVIIAGFSNGGDLTLKTMKRLANKPGIYAIVAGVPWWYQNFNSDSILHLTNNGQDTLVAGDYGAVALAVIESPFKWIWAKIHRRNLSLAQAIEFPGHDYPWVSREVGPPIVKFLDAKIKPEALKEPTSAQK